MRRLSVVAAVLVAIVTFALPSEGAPGAVYRLRVTGMIEPAVARYVGNGIDTAEREKATAVVIELDTPGGLYEPMREIVSKMLNSRVPVIVYVSPNGARAASAGAFITIAANVAAMAPVTNIGSAHPVLVSPGSEGTDSQREDSTMMQKVVNDSAKYMVIIAEKRGRNANWAEKAVRKSDNITATEAEKLNVIDFVAEDLRQVLAKADGMTVRTEAGTITLKTKDAPIVNYPMKWYTVLLQYLADPTVAFFLMLIAIYGIIFEINTPGATIPGVIAVVAILFLLYSFSVLPLSLAGLFFIILAIAFFIAEAMVASHGVLSVGGIIAFFLGSLMVFNSGMPGGFGVPIAILLAGTLATAVFFAIIAGWAVRALKMPVVTGREALIGSVVEARTNIDPTGKVFAEGTWWTAVTQGEPIAKGEKVKITGMDGLKLKVVRADDNDEREEP